MKLRRPLLCLAAAGALFHSAAGAHAAAVGSNGCKTHKSVGRLSLDCALKNLKLISFSVVTSKSPARVNFQLACDNPTEKSAGGGVGGPAYAGQLVVAHGFQRSYRFSRPKTGALVCRASLHVRILGSAGSSTATIRWTSFGSQVKQGLPA